MSSQPVAMSLSRSSRDTFRTTPPNSRETRGVRRAEGGGRVLPPPPSDTRGSRAVSKEAPRRRRRRAREEGGGGEGSIIVSTIPFVCLCVSRPLLGVCFRFRFRFCFCFVRVLVLFCSCSCSCSFGGLFTFISRNAASADDGSAPPLSSLALSKSNGSTLSKSTANLGGRGRRSGGPRDDATVYDRAACREKMARRDDEPNHRRFFGAVGPSAAVARSPPGARARARAREADGRTHQPRR